MQQAATQSVSTPAADDSIPLPDTLEWAYPLVFPENQEQPAGSSGWATFVSCVDDSGAVLVADNSLENRYWEARFDPDSCVWVPIADGERLADGEVVETYPLDQRQPLDWEQREYLGIGQ